MTWNWVVNSGSNKLYVAVPDDIAVEVLRVLSDVGGSLGFDLYRDTVVEASDVSTVCNKLAELIEERRKDHREQAMRSSGQGHLESWIQPIIDGLERKDRILSTLLDLHSLSTLAVQDSLSIRLEGD